MKKEVVEKAPAAVKKTPKAASSTKAHALSDEKKAHKEKETIAPSSKSTAKPTDTKKSESVGAQPEINIGMIGHVDHGKTSLTKALTGKWCDTHSEEVKRGISIRLGYADATFYKIKTPTGIVYTAHKDEVAGEVVSQRTVSFVDAPGHETLMTTMLSGAALMNGAVLVIAANEFCPQPRTIEHLMALKFAGVERIVVAQNKIDLVTKEDAMKQHAIIDKFLTDYGYPHTPIIPTSANFNANIDMLIEAIETHIATPQHDVKAPVKMFVARSFDINKPGTDIAKLRGAVLGGSISQGTIKIGDTVELLPGLKGRTKTTVVSIATDRGRMDVATPGGLIAIGTTLDPSIAQNDRLRGQIISAIGSMGDPVKNLVLKVHMFERVVDPEMKDKVMIKINDPLVITIGTNTVVGFVSKTDPKHTTMVLKNEVVAQKGEKVAVSKNINGQWRLIAFAEIQ